MKKDLMTALQIIALGCAYLIISIPVISASQISVYMPGGATVEFSVNFSSKVDRNITIVHDPDDQKWQNVEIKVEIVGKDPAYAVKKIYLFKCKDSEPVACSGYQPVEATNYLSGKKGTFYWDDVSEDSTASFMSIVEMENSGKTIWVGFWDSVKRSGLQGFEHTSHELDSMDLHAKSGVDSDWIKNYVEKFFMVPMTWLESVVLGTVDGKAAGSIFKLSADGDDLNSPVFETQTEQVSSVTQVSKDFMLVFGKGDSVSSPLTLFSGMPFGCGDGACESYLGEDSSTCCIDCACPGDQECSVDGTYPNGVCHTCGDGAIEPTEDQVTCCADAGCPAGESCDTTRNVPYGSCVLPDCGNTICDSPVEDVANCCIDCGGNAACASLIIGSYCNMELVNCTLPVCGDGTCEPGEDYSNCCADCSGCPAGEYCNTNQSVSGVCVPSQCGDGECEPGEDYSNCCMDCDLCPLDQYTGEQQSCSLNQCHACGNGILEEPAETESTCCQDTGCPSSGKYCAEQGGCESTSAMGLSVLVSPDSIDCTLNDPINMRIVIENKPYHFDYLRSIYYSYGGYTRQLSCQESIGWYDCQIPVTGSDTFPGCFNSGSHAVDITMNIYYFADYNHEEVWNTSSAALSGTATFNVAKSRTRICNMNGQCELGIGEAPETCCWDCDCGGDSVCSATGCVDESAVTMWVDPTSVTPRDQIDCTTGIGEVTFSVDVQNTPYSSYDGFDVIDWDLVYGDKNFSSYDLPGFDCDPEVNNLGLLTGRVTCSIPVSVFPACPYEPPAYMEMIMYVTGGGLSSIYGPYGKNLTGNLNVNYIKGLPNCGDGAIDDAETSESCCRDAGCPAGTMCSLLSGCIEEGQMDITATADPVSVNCSVSSGEISFVAEVNPKPINMVGFGGTSIDGMVIDHYCYPDDQSMYEQSCTIPLVDLPYCWEVGPKQVTFETSVIYLNGTEGVHVPFSKQVPFHVSGKRERGCNMNDMCEPSIGELPDQCCSDCGCTGSKVCTMDNVCKDSSEVALSVAPVGQVDCSGQSGYLVTMDTEIVNQPYGTMDIDWHILMQGETYGADIISCDISQGENKYECLTTVYNLPLCHTQDTKTMTLVANISHMDALGYYHYTAVEDDVTIQTENWLDSCTNPITGGNIACQAELGENQETCCQDCGCSGYGDDYVCTSGGCKPKSAVSLSISPASIDTDCTILPDSAHVGKSMQAITKYLCKFKEPIVIDADVQNLPVQTSDPIDLYYYMDGDKDEKVSDFIAVEEKTTTGWKIKVLPRPVESASKNIPKNHVINIGFTLSTYDLGNEIVIPLESEEISLKYNAKESEHLASIYHWLKSLEKDLRKFHQYLGIVAFVVGFCTPCTAHALGVYMAGGSAGIVPAGVWAQIVGYTGIITGVLGISMMVRDYDEAWAYYAIGFVPGFMVWVWTCPEDCGLNCPAFYTACTVLIIAAIIALFIILGRMEDAVEDTKKDIESEIALAKSDVGDDISFYYGQG